MDTAANNPMNKVRMGPKSSASVKVKSVKTDTTRNGKKISSKTLIIWIVSNKLRAATNFS